VLGDWHLRAEGWTSVHLGVDTRYHTGGGAIFDKPQERSPERWKQDLRVQPKVRRTARTGKSLCRRGPAQDSIHTRNAQSLAAKAKRTAKQKASTTTRFDFGRRCEIVVELGRANFMRGRQIP
jgi:hypothetical protein